MRTVALGQTLTAFRPSPFRPITSALQGRPVLGQAPDVAAQLSNVDGMSLGPILSLLKGADTTALVQKLGVEKGLALVAALIRESGVKVSSALDLMYNKHKGVPQSSIGNWIGALVALNPLAAGWYTYVAGNSQRRAAAELVGIDRIAADWMDQAQKNWFDTEWRGGTSDRPQGTRVV